MYKGIVFSNGRRYDEMRGWLSTAFGGQSWAEIMLPHFRHENTAQKVYFLRLGEIFFFYTNNLNSIRSIYHYPVPIVGTVVPVVNNMIEPDFVAMQLKRNSFDRRGDHIGYLSAVRSLYQWYSKPIVLLVINGNDPPTLTQRGHSDWWDAEMFRDVVSESENPDLPVSGVECSIDHLDQIPERFAEAFNLRPELLTDQEPIDCIPHPHLPNVTIHPENLGVGEGIAHRFVEECLSQLIPTNIHFRVWIDVFLPTKFRIEDDDGTKTEWGYPERPMLYYRTFDRNVVLYPREDCGSSKTPIQLAHHVYLEYEGCVFDSIMAFQQPIALVEFQERMTGNWRTHIEITPEMSVDEAKSLVRETVERVKRGVLD